MKPDFPGNTTEKGGGSLTRFSCGTELISGPGALDFLSTLGAKKVLLVTDSFFSQNGTAEAVLKKTGADGEIFGRAVPDPPAQLAAEGAALLRRLQPDLLLALGGGSSLDCAKGILLAAESRIRFVAVPTTSGTGSEVTSFAVLTHNGVKHPLVDKVLRPDVAILDDALLSALPPGLVADAGMDAVTHCVEAAAATGAGPFTDALAGGALNVLLRDLPASFHGDPSVRGAIHTASAMAGLSFDNAGLGLLHAAIHALGGVFHVPHGRLGGILLPLVMDFNRDAALKQYAGLARFCGHGAATELLAFRALRGALLRLRRQLQLPGTLEEAGVDGARLESLMDSLVHAALADPCLAANPRPVTEADLRRLFLEAAHGG